MRYLPRSTRSLSSRRVDPSNGRLPETNVYSITPNDHTSTSGPSYFLPWKWANSHVNEITSLILRVYIKKVKITKLLGLVVINNTFNLRFYNQQKYVHFQRNLAQYITPVSIFFLIFQWHGWFIAKCGSSILSRLSFNLRMIRHYLSRLK